MTPKLPVVSGKLLIKFLEKVGYKVVSQRGSHVKLLLRKGGREYMMIVPLHREIARGTLNDILGAVSKHTGIPREKLREALRKY